MKNDVVELNITDLTSEGYGVGRNGNKVVFVPDTAVGDRVRALILKEQTSVCYAKPLEILSPSPDRIAPDCAVAHKCGGCVFRHISYPSELALKKSAVEAAFSRIAKLDLTVGDTVHGSPERYRNKVQYPFAPSENGGVCFGYYARRSHRIVEHTDCPLQDAVFTEIARYTSELATELGVPAYDERAKGGVLRHIVMRKNREGELLVCLVIAKKFPESARLASSLCERFPSVVGVHYNINKKADNVIFGDITEKAIGKDTLTDTLCGKIFEISPRAFFQVNSVMAEKLYNKAKSLLPEREGRIILDLYCGAGTIGLSLAKDTDKLVGVEIVEDAVENAVKNARLNGRSPENTLFVCGDASVGVSECKKKFGAPEVIILDPPRKGLETEVIKTVVNASPESVIYISCNPATLARDCAIFAEYGYTAHTATPFDLFPRTGHCECVCSLTRKQTER